MKEFLEILLPVTAGNVIYGMRLPVYVFMAIAVVSTIRSLIHMFAPDGGAGSIAGMDLSVQGASGIVFVFALWGSSQLVYALIQLLVAFRYQSLVPFMYLLLIVETLLRQLAGHLKPVTFKHTPPGAIGDYVMLPLAALMLALSIWSAITSTPRLEKEKRR